ncbi:MAG: amino acid synthesis family protein, partial [Caldimonas sp.]
MQYAAAGSQPQIDVRKLVLTVEDVGHDGGPRAAQPLRRGSIAALLHNPYAGRYVEDIQPMMEALKPLGREMARRLIDALGGPGAIQGYGKGALVGTAGEQEHGALWHVPGGYGMRDILD